MSDTIVPNSYYLGQLKEHFGYVPEHNADLRHCIYHGGIEPILIVLHPQRKPRMYRMGCGGNYEEFDPDYGR